MVSVEVWFIQRYLSFIVLLACPFIILLSLEGVLPS